MKYITDGYGERCRFDAFCKTVLRNEARTYLRDLARQRNRETEFSALSQYEMDKLCMVDEYPSDSVVFTAFGCDLHIPGRADGRCLCKRARTGTEHFDPVLCVGTARR